MQTAASADKTLRAVGAIVFSVFALALGDAIIKSVSATFTLWQIFTLRSVCVLPILIVMLKRRRVPIYPKQPGWTVLRSLMLTVMWVAYYAALPHINLSVAAATFYTSPIFITIFAALFLKDAIGKGGWCAIFIGFAGVLFVLQPRAEDFNWFALLPVSSAVLYALSMILTRSHCKSENILVLSLWLNFAMLIVGGTATLALIAVAPTLPADAPQAFLFGQWLAMGAAQWGAIAVLSLAILIGSIGAAYAYQNGAPATIATFDFAYIAFALVWSVVIFQETPVPVKMAGMVLIVSAGILAVRSRAAQAR